MACHWMTVRWPGSVFYAKKECIVLAIERKENKLYVFIQFINLYLNTERVNLLQQRYKLKL